MNLEGSVVNKPPHKIKIEKPAIRNPEDERLWQEVRKFSNLVPHEPDPNQGRVQEIKEELRKGTYLTRDKIDEAAARIAARFLKPE